MPVLLADAVEWHVNVPYNDLKQLLGGAVGGLHTMLDEHFGISVVEYMAAGELRQLGASNFMRQYAGCSACASPVLGWLWCQPTSMKLYLPEV